MPAGSDGEPGPEATAPVVAAAWATAADLSAAQRDFVAYASAHPEGRRRIDHRGVPYPAWMVGPASEYYPLQSWPTFIGAAKLAEIRDANVGVWRLLRAIPERIFDRDPHRLASYYGLAHAGLAELLLEPPNGLDGALTRNDLIDSADGLKCLEVNAGRMGGWQLRYFERAYRDHPLIAAFLDQHGLAPRHRDPLAALFEHVVRDNAVQPHCAAGVLNLAIVIPPSRLAATAVDDLDRAYQELLRRDGRGLAGKLVVTCYSALAARRGTLHDGDLSLQALVELTGEPRPEVVFRAFKAGRVTLYNGPIEVFLNDKRNLALLSQHADSDRFSGAEQALIRRHVPWSRELVASEVAYQGERWPLGRLLRERRRDLVVKPSTGSQGRDVFVGRFTPEDAWRSQVEKLVGQPGWLVQEYVASRPYLYQAGESGTAVHDVIWGTFVCGDDYAGGFLRMIPSGHGGVINSARGAVEGIMFEV
jgi:hypothetical protein